LPFILGAAVWDRCQFFSLRLVLFWSVVGHLLSLLVAYVIACLRILTALVPAACRIIHRRKLLHHPVGLGLSAGQDVAHLFDFGTPRKGVRVTKKIQGSHSPAPQVARAAVSIAQLCDRVAQPPLCHMSCPKYPPQRKAPFRVVKNAPTGAICRQSGLRRNVLLYLDCSCCPRGLFSNKIAPILADGAAGLCQAFVKGICATEGQDGGSIATSPCQSTGPPAPIRVDMLNLFAPPAFLRIGLRLYVPARDDAVTRPSV